jgi:parallel beta-helix repeat protein
MHPFLMLLVVLAQTPPIVIVDRDNIEITESCSVQVAAKSIIDADNNGVIHITGDGLTIDFAEQSLHGAAPQVSPNDFTGTGIAIAAKNVTLRNATISGYKVGIHAINADGLTIHDCDVSNNFHQHLKSTAKAEDGGDWLWPHNNDNNQWITNYGAGLCVEDSSNVTIHNIHARDGQNGIVFDRVNDSKIYDCDCSFLSGWGLAMWRSSRNVISRNAFDFCVRGYSHGIYNRGQDSAGILMFEQCCDNIIAENSVTHGGDGLFSFAGKEALGEIDPHDDLQWYKRRGCNGNIFNANDFSFAAAHGLELTFSFDNTIQNNRFWNNAICGIWGGYSQDTIIRNNNFQRNGGMAYGSERGGIAIEHGERNIVAQNIFVNNACAIRLWWDDDKSLLEQPWGKANEANSTKNQILHNTFNNNRATVELEQTTHTALHLNKGALHRLDDGIEADEASLASLTFDAHAEVPPTTEPEIKAIYGSKRPVVIAANQPPKSARAHLAGRENIVMTEWGPWDHRSPMLQFVQNFDTADEYKLHGSKSMPTVDQIRIEGDAYAIVRGDLIAILAKQQDTISPYRIELEVDGRKLNANGLLTGGEWIVSAFPSTVDPREDVEQWRTAGLKKPSRLTVDKLDLRFGSGGMAEALDLPIKLTHDHFGAIATRSLTFPAGTWRIKTLSDDGIRVWLDDQLFIDDWTHHAPKEHAHEFKVDQQREIKIRVEHFELDGHAVLWFDIEPVAK